MQHWPFNSLTYDAALMNPSRKINNVISEHLELTQATRIAMTNARRNGTRALLLVQDIPFGWLEDFACNEGSAYVDSQSSTDRADRISAALGAEQLMITMQLASRPDLGLLAAVAGTLVAGGVLILGLSSGEQSHSSQRLLRLVKQLAVRFPDRIFSTNYVPVADRTSYREKKQTYWAGTQLEGIEGLNTEFTPKLSNAKFAQKPNPLAVAEQNKLLLRACAHLETHSSGCLLIKGRRGRGKSTLLARTAMHLEHRSAQFRVTAMHESALKTYRHHKQFDDARFISPENAVSTPPAILLVEEASSFALAMLQTYLATCPHVVFCTTTEGYEASGRALDIRLLNDVARYAKPVLQLRALQPWRWAADDPLEQFLDALLLVPTDSRAVAVETTANSTSTSTSTSTISAYASARGALSNNTQGPRTSA